MTVSECTVFPMSHDRAREVVLDAALGDLGPMMQVEAVEAMVGWQEWLDVPPTERALYPDFEVAMWLRARRTAAELERFKVRPLAMVAAGGVA